MLKIKQLFCRHNYRKTKTQETSYCEDYFMFEDTGDWKEVTYKCKKCGKIKINFEHKLNNRIVRRVK